MVTIEDRVAALMADANPVPDYEQIELAAKGAAYLATLDQRSSKVAQLDTRPTEQQDQKRQLMPWLAAAVAAVVLGAVALLLVNQGNDDTPPATSPSPSTVPASLESFEEIWATGGVEVQFKGAAYVISEGGSRSDSGQWAFQDGEITLTSGADSEDCSSGAVGVYEYAFVDDQTLTLTGLSDECTTRPGLSANTITLTLEANTDTGDPDWDATTVFVSPEGPSGIAPGEYRTARFSLPFRFELDAGWTSFLQERSDALSLASLNPDTHVEVHLFEPATVLETLDFFDRPELNMSPAAEVTIDGASGYTVILDPSEQAVLFNDLLDGAYGVVPGSQYWLWVVDVNGTPVTIVHQFTDDDGLTKGSDLIRRIDWKDN